MKAGAVDFIEKPFASEAILSSLEVALSRLRKPAKDPAKAAAAVKLALLSPPTNELIERAIRDAVAVEIDLVAVSAQDEAAILFGQQARNPPVVGYRMQFDISTRLTNVVFELSAGRVENVADRDINVFMRVVPRGIPGDRDLAAGSLQVDSHPEQIALKTPRVLAFDDNATRHDAIKEIISPESRQGDA